MSSRMGWCRSGVRCSLGTCEIHSKYCWFKINCTRTHRARKADFDHSVNERKWNCLLPMCRPMVPDRKQTKNKNKSPSPANLRIQCIFVYLECLVPTFQHAADSVCLECGIFKHRAEAARKRNFWGE